MLIDTSIFVKSSIRSPSKDQEIRKPEPKKSENELHWEELVKNMTRPLTLCDLDFTDLRPDDDKDDLMPRGLGGSVPPPPPPIGIPPPMKPMLQMNLEAPSNFRHMNGSKSQTSAADTASTIKKNKKTVSYTRFFFQSNQTTNIHTSTSMVNLGEAILERDTRGFNSTECWKNHLG